MKILVLTQYFYPEAFRVNDLVKGLKSRGHDVTVLTAQPNYPHGKIFDGYGSHRKIDDFDGIPVLRVPIIPRKKGGKVGLIANYLSFIFFATFFGLPRLRGKRFDVCFVFATSPITSAIPANIYRMFTGTPVAIWIQDLWPDAVTSVGMIKNSTLVRMIGQIVKWIYKRSDLLFIQSEGFRSGVLKWGARDSQIRFLPNWAEDFYKPAIEAKPVKPLKILFAGNIGRAQGLTTVLGAAEKLTKADADIEWHFIGDGAMRAWLEAEVERRDLKHRVKIFPRRSAHLMPETFQQYSALLVSLSKDEALAKVLPSKVQSALASGMPILASGDGELARVITDAHCGLVGPAGDADALASNALKLSDLAQADLNNLGKSGRAYYDQNFLRAKCLDDACSELARVSRSN